jgi:hypothetical protein
MLKRFSTRKKLIVTLILIGVLPVLLTTYIGVKIASGRLGNGIEALLHRRGGSSIPVELMSLSLLEDLGHPADTKAGLVVLIREPD